jgi:hypothetical protein
MRIATTVYREATKDQRNSSVITSYKDNVSRSIELEAIIFIKISEVFIYELSTQV